MSKCEVIGKSGGFMSQWQFCAGPHLFGRAPSVLLIHGDKIRMGAGKTTGGLTLSSGGWNGLRGT